MPHADARPRANAPLTVGLLITWFEDSYSILVINGVADLLREQGVNLICFVGGRPRSPLQDEAGANVLYDLVGPESIDGLILMSGTLVHFIGVDAMQDFCARYRPLPMVSIAVPVLGIPSVTVSSGRGLREVLGHLIEVHGHRSIAFVRGPEGSDEAESRFRTYRDVLTEQGISIDADLVVPGTFDYPAGEDAVRLLVDERHAKLDAIVAANDAMALGALEALGSRGIRVPEDVAVIGFDDTEAASFASPPLTTVRQPLTELGRTAASLLLEQLERGGDAAASCVLETEPVIRESCGCMPRTIAPIVSDARASAPDFIDVLRGERARVAAAMSEAVGGGAANDQRGKRLLDALATDLIEPSRYFLHTLDQILTEVAARGEDLYSWQNAITALRNWALPKLVHDRRACIEAEGIFFRSKGLIGDKAQRYQGQRRILAESRSRSLNDLGRRLIEADDLADVAAALRIGMTELGVRGCYVSLYEDPKAPAGWARLLLATDASGQLTLCPDGFRFPSRELLPKHLLEPSGPFALVAEPLYLRSDQIGFALFDCTLHSGTFYDDLRQQLSSTLKRLEREADLSRLHEAARERSEELERAYRVMRENQERLILSENMAALGKLAAGMAHEINTPLAAVRMALEELAKLTAEYRVSRSDPLVTIDDHREIAKEIRDSIQLAAGAADRVAGFVQGIRFQTREGSSEDRRRFDAVPVIQDTILLLAHALRKASSTVSFKPSAPRVEIYGSPGRLAQVVTNLLTNAADACKSKGGGLITIRLASEPGQVTLRVSDAGTGIAPENLKRIFDPMFTTKPFGEGTGLGLSIVHNIVVGDFHGTVEVDSGLGRGTTFTLRFVEPEGASA